MAFSLMILSVVWVYSPSFMGGPSRPGSFSRKITARREMAQNTGRAKKAKYQTISANAAPNMGLTTLPVPLEASVKPRALLSVAPLKRSPANAMAMGAVPAAPKPCKARAAIRTVYEPQIAPKPARIPAEPYTIREGIITAFREKRSDRNPLTGINKPAVTENKVMTRLD
ncbi:hypothetical protein D3C75_900000 [compost metagenome]